MAKEFYRILEINETATQDEIKKSYKKLALKYHPDRNKSPDAAKKMKEINKAYEVLGNEELRKRYDLGETEFTFTASESNYSHEEELKNIGDELKGLKEEQKILARKDVINMIGFEMLITEIYPRQLDSNLWTPYDKWQDKVWKIEITDDDTKEYGIDTSKLDKFKETMINAIRKRKEEWKAGINNPYFDKTKTSAIEAIEEAMKEKGLKAEDLGEYSNYKEQINNLDRQWKIRNLRDKIKDYVRQQGRKHTKEEFGSLFEKQKVYAIEEIEKLMSKKNLQDQDLGEYSNYRGKINELNEVWRIRDLRDRVIENINSQRAKEQRQGQKGENFGNLSTDQNKQDGRGKEGKIDYNSLTWKELINAINQKDLENSSLKEIVSALEKKINELEEEIKELKTEPQTAEIRQEIRKRENYLQEAKNSLEKINSSNTQNPKGNETKNNNFPTGWVIGGGVLAVVGLIAGLIIIKKGKKSKKL